MPCKYLQVGKTMVECHQTGPHGYNSCLFRCPVCGKNVHDTNLRTHFNQAHHLMRNGWYSKPHMA